nr:autophagy-related protein 2 [Tanacetum cinerariifolium]
MAREVSESCMDSLLTEIVSSYSNVLYASKPELAARRIEAIGYHVGHQLSERYTMERPRFSDHLEAIKFICKDFWSELFKKQIDNLKTNHRGTFVLQDDKFAWLSRMSVAPSAETSGSTQEPGNKAAEVTGMHLYFPCGIIRGALSNLGIPCAVSADISNLPACSFVIRIKVLYRVFDVALAIMFGEAAILVVKDGAIGSLTVKFSWGGKCEIELEELEIVLAPGRTASSNVGNEASTSGQDGDKYTSHETVTPERHMFDSGLTSASADIHEGVKTIAKMVKWLLTSFHVKIKKLYVVLNPSSLEPDGIGDSRMLVLKFNEVECGTRISEDVDIDSQRTPIDSFLGLSRLTNFVKFDGGVLEFLRDGKSDESALTPVITGEKGGFSGTIKLSIPLKNGSLDIRKLDADVCVGPLEMRLQPSSIKSFMYFVNVFEELDKQHESLMNSIATESIYHSVSSSHGYSSTLGSFEPETCSAEKDTVLNALLRGSHLISDWMTSPVGTNQELKIEESDFGASVDQFFECFDELRNSQSALGNSGMWNWSCSVFSAITAASNLASGSLQIPSEQKHVETSLKARIMQIVILFSFVDEDQKPSYDTKGCKTDGTSYVHYLKAELNEMQLAFQVCPQESNIEATIEHIEVSDHFSLHCQNENVNAQALLIRNKQAAVERACPPLRSLGESAVLNDLSRCHRGIYRDDVVKVLLLRASDTTRCQYVAPVSGPDSFSLKLPPLLFWVNFHLLNAMLNLIKEIEKSLKLDGKRDGAKVSRPQFLKSPKETLRGNITLLDARMVLCFPCEKNDDYKSYSSLNKFIVVDLSLTPREGKVRSSQRFRVTPSRSLHFSVGNIAVYFVSSASGLTYCAERILTISHKSDHPSVFSMLWQDNAVTGSWITGRAKVLATSDGTTGRNKSTGKGHGLAFVTTTKDMDDLNSRSRGELVSSSSFFMHAHLSPLTINLNSSLYQTIHDISNQVTDCLSCKTSDSVDTTEKHSTSQSSILVECDLVEVSIGLAPVEDIKGSIQSELPGSWCDLKLKVCNFELLTVSNTGGRPGANFLWVSHGEGDLWGSTTGDSNREFILIRCDNSTRGRGNGEGSNILSSRFPGSDIIHMWDPDNFMSQVSINIRCATVVAVGGRLDWFNSITSFFSQASTEINQVDDAFPGKEDLRNDKSCGSSFVLNLIDIGLSYEPYLSSLVAQEDPSREECVAGLLAASSLILSNVKSANCIEMDYEIKFHDVGLMLCEESGVKNLFGSYSEQNLRKCGYVKVAEETHVEAVLRINCKNGHEWELECSESHLVLHTCQDSTFGLARLAAQIQQIIAPDVEESVVHLQTRWDSIQLAQESCYKSRSSSNYSTSSDSEAETYTVNLMDEISEGAFDLDPDHERVPHKSSVKVAVPVYGLEDNETSSSCSAFPEFIDGYFLSSRPLSESSSNNQQHSSKSATAKEAEAHVGSGWYGGSLLKIVEDHVSGSGTSHQQFVGSENPVSQTGNDVKVKGRLVLTNINVRWTLQAGSDWEYTRNKDIGLEFALAKMGLRCDVYPDGEISVSKVSVSVQDFSLNDVSKGAPWTQVLGCYQTKNRPRDSRSRALKIELESVRPHPSTPLEEYRLKIAVLPMRLHLHQSQLEFLIGFFGGKSSSSDYSSDMVEPGTPQKKAVNVGNHSILEEALLPYFQKFSISPVLFRVDYIPSGVDLVALGHGKYVELVNLFQWKGVELKLKHVQAVGVYGWSSVCETIFGEWLEDISQNQIHKLLKGLPPIRSLVAVGTSAAKLVSLPVKNYRKDRRIVNGMQRGTIAFLRSVSLEAIGLGAHLAAGAHAILVQAEDIISTSPPSVPRPIQTRVNPNVRSAQPKDARQGVQQAFETITDGLGKSASALVQTPLKKYQRGDGVGSALSTAVQAAPGAAIAPASAAARAVHSALLGVRNSLDPEHKKDSMDKYLGTTHSQLR